MSHTPAPWTHTKAGRVVGPEGNTIADCRYKNGAHDGPLIAAAPQLLEALKAALVEFEASHEVMLLNPAMRGMKEAAIIPRIRAAIAKATGGAA